MYDVGFQSDEKFKALRLRGGMRQTRACRCMCLFWCAGHCSTDITYDVGFQPYGKLTALWLRGRMLVACYRSPWI